MTNHRPTHRSSLLPITGALVLALGLVGTVLFIEPQPPRRSTGSRVEVTAAVEAARVLGPDACAECHVDEAGVWQESAHYLGARELSRSPEARAIAKKLGIRRMKSDARCTSCHFTLQSDETGELDAIAAVSCESCHGPANDWIELHDDFGGAATAADESAEHRVARLESSSAAGLLHTGDLVGIAGRCFSCHSIANPELVAAGHPLGDGFELASWSQGEVRHNFVRGGHNPNSEPARLRLMFVLGQLADMEHACRALAAAAPDEPFAAEVEKRASKSIAKLGEIAALLPAPELSALVAQAGNTPLSAGSDYVRGLASAAHECAVAFETGHRGAELEQLAPLVDETLRASAPPGN